MAEGLLKKVKFPPAGKYTLAVSGGVDSVSLLDILQKAAKRRKYQLVVAHFDHGMRPDSKADRLLVEELAKKHGLMFEYKAARLGKVSEAKAREARYDWLTKVKNKHKADKIITAHHFDDALETAIFNAGRGADNLGLTPLHLGTEIVRPLLDIRKKELIQYAKAKELKWREDLTNQDLSIARNYIRQLIVPLLTAREINQYQKLIADNQKYWEYITNLFKQLVKVNQKSLAIKRNQLVPLNFEDIKALLRLGIKQFGFNIESANLARLANYVKVGNPGTSFPINKNLRARIKQNTIYLVSK